MQITLDTLTEYKSQTADGIKDTGFAQKGYHSILRYDTWKEQKCILSKTKTDSESIKDVTFSTGEWIDLIDLKEYVDLIQARGATHIFVTENYNDEDVTSINIDAIKRFTVWRDEDEFYTQYEAYVKNTNLDNLIIWGNYKRELEQAEKAEYNELQKFLDAKKIYESLKGKFE